MTTDIEMAATRLLWREQARAMPRSLRYALRRLFRREPRMYLYDDATGTVLARFTSDADHLAFMAWLTRTHEWSFSMGKEFQVATYLANRADAGADSPE